MAAALTFDINGNAQTVDASSIGVVREISYESGTAFYQYWLRFQYTRDSVTFYDMTFRLYRETLDAGTYVATNAAGMQTIGDIKDSRCLYVMCARDRSELYVNDSAFEVIITDVSGDLCQATFAGDLIFRDQAPANDPAGLMTYQAPVDTLVITSGVITDIPIYQDGKIPSTGITGSGITELTGDVTAGPGSGSQAATIANDAVTYAKMQNVSAASKLLGRGDSGSGDVQEITLGSGLSMSGTTLSASGGGAGTLQTASALSTTLQTVTDAGSNASTLKLATNKAAIDSAFELGVNAAATTQTTASITITSSGSNAGAAIVPKGTGALTSAIPDGTTTGGNARGNNAIDLQTKRTNANQVASASSAVIIGGESNRASGNTATCVGGNGNAATGAYSSTVGGQNLAASGTGAYAMGVGNTASANYSFALGNGVTADKIGQLAVGGAQFVTNDNHLSIINVGRSITGTGIAELFTNTVSTRLTIGSNRAWSVRVQVVAIGKTVGNGSFTVGDVFTEVWDCAIKNIGGTTALVGTPAIAKTLTDANMSTSVVTITADDTNDSLKIEFTPPSTAGSTSVTRVKAALFISEIAN